MLMFLGLLSAPLRRTGRLGVLNGDGPDHSKQASDLRVVRISASRLIQPCWLGSDPLIQMLISTAFLVDPNPMCMTLVRITIP